MNQPITPELKVCARTYPASHTCCRRQSSVEHNSSYDQAEEDGREQQQPAPILAWVAQSADEMSSIVVGNDCDGSVTGSPANRYDRYKPPNAVLRSTCCREKDACRKRKRHCRRDRKSTGASSVEISKNDIQLAMSELAVQVG
jgi:hypothetical protein